MVCTTHLQIIFYTQINLKKMKKIFVILIALCLSVPVFSQNITNTLGTNGSYIIKDATNTFFTLLQSTGHVGIGSNTFDATNPEQLKVDAGVTSSKNLISGYGTINSYLQLNIQNFSNGSSASSDIVATNDIGNESKGYLDMGINSSGYTDAAYNIGGKNDAYIYCMGNTGGSPVGGNLSIGTGSSTGVIKFHTGGTTSSYERMRITEQGYIGINTNNPGTSYRVTINGNISASQFYVPSDIRLKNNIQPLQNILDKILKLRGVSFIYNNDSTGKTQIGFIAQEMEKQFPELVITGDDGIKGVSYSNMTAVLVEGIKEQQNEINDLKTRVLALEQKSGISSTQTAGMNPLGLNINSWLLISILAGGVIVIFIKRRSISVSILNKK